MNKYYTPDIAIIKLHTNDVITASQSISIAGAGADGYEDQGDISSVFGLNN